MKQPQVAGALTSPDSNGSTGWPSAAYNPHTGLFYVGASQSYTIFYKTDTDAQPEAQSLLTTAGNLVFGSAGSGDPLWHAGLISNPSSAPITYMLDGHRYVLVAGGENLCAFRLQ